MMTASSPLAGKEQTKFAYLIVVTNGAILPLLDGVSGEFDVCVCEVMVSARQDWSCESGPALTGARYLG